MAPGSSAPKPRMTSMARSSSSTCCARSRPPRTPSPPAPATSISWPPSTKPLPSRPSHPGVLAMGEEHGRRPAGFDFANSPTELAAADVAGGSSSSGPRPGRRAWSPRGARHGCGAPASSRPRRRPPMVRAAGLGPPTYVITGWSGPGTGVRRRTTSPRPSSSSAPAAACRSMPNGRRVRSPPRTRRSRTLAIGPGHVHPEDIERAVAVDAFDFAMEVTRVAEGLRLDRVAAGVASDGAHDRRQRPRDRLRRRSAPDRRWSCSTARPRPAGPTFAAQIEPLSDRLPGVPARRPGPRLDALGRRRRVPCRVARRRPRRPSSTRSAWRPSTCSASRWAR